MEVRLLGPLEVADGGRSIAYGGARQRAVLALLVLHANQVVASERVLTELWGEDAPPGAANALQAAVSRLRRALPEGRLVTRPPGYLFRAVPDEVDVSRFERLLAQGRQALGDGAAAEAADTLAEALALWRGPALADFRYEPFAQAEIARLEELRLVCVEERIEADLALGAGAELVGELQRLVGDQPLRERLRGQLMLALYRAGRQADALEAYREVRELLLEELGLEPGPALAELETAILRHDPALRTAPAPAPPAAVPVRKPVTVLCAELEVGSGSGAGLDPEALRVVLERAQAILGATLERHGGRLSAVVGRRIVGVFGVPTLHEDDALRAAQAALATKGALEAEAAMLEERGLALSIRVGLATGEALVGGPEPSGFAGDAVGRADELARQAAAGEILVSDQTRRLAAAALEVEPAGGDRFRLLAAPIGARPLPVRLDAPLVGRDGELGRLRDGLARATRDGRPVLATVLGEAGIGKTRLVHELADQVAAEATVLTGRCLPYGDGITFWPLRELVAQAGAPQGTRQELAALLDGEADADRVAEWLAGALGRGGPGDRLGGPPVDQGGTLAAPEIFWATRRLLETLARRRPLVVVLEDLHWAEPTFLDLAEAVATQARAGLLVACLARPELLERRPGWAAGAATAIRVELGPLAEADAGALLGELAGAPPEAGRRLLEVAAGNPLFLEQLAASLGEQHWGEDELQLPATIQALLAARLELLGPGERAVLWRAAVIGRDFTREAVAELLPAEGRAPLGRHLRALAAKGLVETPPPGAPGRFHSHHLLVQQAAYRAIPKSHRAELHQRFAAWSEGQAAEDEIVGYHLEQAVRYRGELGLVDEEVRGLARRGAGHLEAAGTRAHARGDVPAAVRLLQRAAALLPAGDPARARVQTGLGAALMEAGRLDQAGRALEEAGRIAGAAGDERLAARARVQRLLLGLQVDMGATAAEVGQALPELLTTFERAADEVGRCQAWRLRAAVHWLQADSAAAEDAWRQAAVHARQAGDDRQLTEVLGWLASAALWGPTPAPEGIRRCEGYLEEVGSHQTGEAVILNHLAGLYAMQDQAAEAGRLLARGMAAFEELGLTMTSSVTHPASFVAMLAGDAATAEAHLRRDYEGLEAMGEKGYLATTAAFLAQAIAAQGRHDEAERFIAVSREAAGEDDYSAQMVWQGLLGRILAARGQRAEAEELARSAVALAARTDFLNQHGDALLELAEVLAAAGRTAEARAAVTDALELYGRKGNLVAAARARRRLERLTGG
ncbi:MAG TPA: BTAD domain-containing putative transcriptional regulator [Actinomycetota bacterium]|nr:BTAD domain-containing putative transcriptional regulator [Actinomycetota bacterium]